MTTRYRDITDIVAQILRSAAQGEGITKTQIMYKVFLSFEQLKKYLPLLIKEGLLDYDDRNERLYTVTEKGIKFLQKYEQISEYMPAMPEDY